MTEHWMDRRLREKKPIILEGNLIRIPAKAFVKLQEFKNAHSTKRQSLHEAHLEYMENNK